MVGRYELIRRLALGREAETFLARELSSSVDEQLVVVRRLLPAAATNQLRVDGFLTGARVSAQLEHENIVRVDRIDVDADYYYYAMEYVRGIDLAQVMHALTERGRVVPIDGAVLIAIALCSGLDYAHDRRADLVHGHVSPSKVLLSDAGAVKLGGFGITGPQHERAAGYLSPEQCADQPVDRRSDVFSVGVILYELTTGVRLFRDLSRGEIMRPTIHRAVYPPSLETIVMRALEHDPFLRYQTAGDLLRDLRGFLAIEGLSGSPTAIGDLVAMTTRLTAAHALPHGVPMRDPTPAKTGSTTGSIAQLAASAVVLPMIRRWWHRWQAFALAATILAGLGISGLAVYQTRYAPAPPLYVAHPAPPALPPRSMRAASPRRPVLAVDAPKRAGVAGPAHAAQSTHGAAAEPAHAGIAGPTRVAIAEPTHVAIAEPTRGGIAEPARVAVAEPAHGGIAEPARVGVATHVASAGTPAVGDGALPVLSSVDVRGPLASSVVRRELEVTLPALRTCYRAVARGKGLGRPTTVGLLFDVDEGARAINVRATGDPAFATLHGCVMASVSRIRTAQQPDAGNAHVYVTIAFRP